MSLKDYLIIIFFCSIDYSFAQVNVSSDSTKSKMEVIDIMYGCLDSNRINNYYFLNDSVLVEFFKQVEEAGNRYSWSGDSLDILLEILKRTECNTTKVCLLPFLRTFDSDANEIYKTNCKVSPRDHLYGFYCKEEPLQFLMLFYVHFTIVNPLKLKEGEFLYSVDLIKKKSDSQGKLSQTDYSELYSSYISWLSNTNLKKRNKRNPLASSNYSWKVKTIRVK